MLLIMFALAMSLPSCGCSENATGPSAREVEAQQQAAAEKQRAEQERVRREVEERRRQDEEQRRQASEQAAQHYSTVAMLVSACITFIFGLIVGFSLGLKTRGDFESQTSGAQNESAAGHHSNLGKGTANV
jgi:Flp pilus assembly protein TadB